MAYDDNSESFVNGYVNSESYCEIYSDVIFTYFYIDSNSTKKLIGFATSWYNKFKDFRAYVIIDGVSSVLILFRMNLNSFNLIS